MIESYQTNREIELLRGAVRSTVVSSAPAFTICALYPDAVGAPCITDASHHAAAGAQVMVLGPGDVAQAHIRDEWIDRRELGKSVALFGAILRLPA